MLNEDDTRVKLVDPKLHNSSWKERDDRAGKTYISRQNHQ
jgi:hypothetical protein